MDNSHSSIHYKKKDKVPILAVKNAYGSCEISLFGAHVLSFVNLLDGRERLWLSESAIFDGVSPIRGGIPICWPWFGSHPEKSDYPSHGYARTQLWQVDSIEEVTNDKGEVEETIILFSPTNANQFDYQDLSVHLKLSVGTKLVIEIVTTNNGVNSIPLSQALHSYFKVDNINKVEIKNIHENYFNKPTGNDQLAVSSPYLIETEVDRIHKLENVSNKTVTIDYINSQNDAQKISMLGADSIVVWNPWKEKSDAMFDMHNDAYKTMLCIEAANTINAKEPLVLAANSQYTMAQIID